MLAVLLAGLLALANPASLSRKPFLNGASQRVGVAPGSLASIHGIGFTAAMPVALDYPGGRAVRLDVLAITDRRLDVWVPATAAVGKAMLRVGSASAEVELVPVAPGLFSLNGLGWGMAESRPSTGPGRSVSLAATGVKPGVAVDITIGNRRVRGVAVGASNRRVAIQFVVPQGTVEGCAVPVLAMTPGGAPSNSVSVAVRRGSGPCVESGPLPSPSARNVLVIRSLEPEPVVTAAFYSGERSDRLGWPPPGACTTLTASAVDSPMAALLQPYAGTPLDPGGVLGLNDGAYRIELGAVPGRPGVYRRTLAGRSFGLNVNAGRLFVTGDGGKDIPRFGVALPTPEPFVWSNQAQVQTIRRNGPLTLEWKQAAGWVGAVIVSSNEAADAGFTYCLTRAAPGSLVIPEGFLQHLPGPTATVYLMAGVTEQPEQSIPGVRITAMRVYVRQTESRIR